MKINEEFDRLWYTVEYQDRGANNWHTCCDATFGTMETAERHLNGFSTEYVDYRIVVHASGIVKAVTQ